MKAVATEAVVEARAVMEAIEQGTTPLSRIALRARRLAQLIDDDEAYWWLRMECEGVPGLTHTEKPRDQNASGRAAVKFAKIRAATNWNAQSLAKLSATHGAAKAVERDTVVAAPLSALEVGRANTEALRARLANDPDEAYLRKLQERDPLHVFDAIANQRERHWAEVRAHLADGEVRQVLERIGSAIHAWATGVYVAHRFREIAGDIFEGFRTRAESMLAELCPDAVRRLNHAVERLSPSSSAEEWAAAAVSCRRALKDLADRLYPPSHDEKGGRKLDDEKYKNRLWAFAKERAASTESGIGDEINALCLVLDRLYELSNKGVHGTIDKHEAELCVLRTYILMSQFSELAVAEQPAPKS